MTRRTRVAVYRDQVVFRTYPEPTRREYFIVRVFSTLKTMRDYHARHRHVLGRLGDARACCHTWKTHKSGRLLPLLGEIHLFKRGLKMRHITHECTHAGMGWLRRRQIALDNLSGETGLMPADCPEEVLCHAVGQMAADVIGATDKAGWLR